MKSLILVLVFALLSLKGTAGYPDGPISITASESNLYGGGYTKVLIYTNCVNIDRKIRKPLIVFEGYDPGYYTKPNEKEGRTGIGTFLDDIKNSDPSQSALIQDLLIGGTQEYDIVYVNWVNGTDYLENNEKVAKAVINWVNAQKVISSSTEPNVIMGRSMGSVIARMALKHMEQEHAANAAKPLHNTRLFISNDGGPYAWH